MKTFISCQLFIFCLLLPILGSAQLVLFTGSIIDGKTGNTIVDVNVFESNSGIGTITNTNGFFFLMIKPGNSEIVISHEGYNDVSQKMVLKSDTNLIISLVPVFNLKSKAKDTEHQKTAEKLNNEKISKKL